MLKRSDELNQAFAGKKIAHIACSSETRGWIQSNLYIVFDDGTAMQIELCPEEWLRIDQVTAESLEGVIDFQRGEAGL